MKSKVKYSLFQSVLRGMCVEQQPELESVEDYSKQWNELIDCGGLYHINDKVSTFYQVTVLYLYY